MCLYLGKFAITNAWDVDFDYEIAGIYMNQEAF